MDLNAEYQIAGETHTDTSKLIQKKEKKKQKKKSIEQLYCETYIQPKMMGGCEQLRAVQE